MNSRHDEELPMQEGSPVPKRGPRLLGLFIAIVLGIAVVGFFVGTQPMPHPDETRHRSDSRAPVSASAVPGQTYRELRLRRFGPNSEVTSDLEQLRPSTAAAIARNEDVADRAHALRQRGRRRAFEGAPPTIPHRIDQQTAGGCLRCHGDGLFVAKRIASMMSHKPFTNCTQCHVPSLDRFDREKAENQSADPRRDPEQVNLPTATDNRAFEGAPPTIPHSVWMRERCRSCHVRTGPVTLATTHPERENCVQCHARAGAGAPWRLMSALQR